jgi:hypothetical protein
MIFRVGMGLKMPITEDNNKNSSSNNPIWTDVVLAVSVVYTGILV